jgi:hypothetical protein
MLCALLILGAAVLGAYLGTVILAKALDKALPSPKDILRNI